MASDTFIYFNDVNGLFSAIHDSLKDEGYAVFSLENVSVDNEQRCVSHLQSSLSSSSSSSLPSYIIFVYYSDLINSNLIGDGKLEAAEG